MLWGGGHRGSFVVTPRRTDIATTRIGSEPAREGRKAGGLINGRAAIAKMLGRHISGICRLLGQKKAPQAIGPPRELSCDRDLPLYRSESSGTNG